MNSAVRRYLAFHRPDFALAASLCVFTDDERSTIAHRLYARLRDRNEPLARHPEIDTERLARCLTAAQMQQLEADAREQTNPTLVCNAFLLMGEAGFESILVLGIETAL